MTDLNQVSCPRCGRPIHKRWETENLWVHTGGGLMLCNIFVDPSEAVAPTPLETVESYWLLIGHPAWPDPLHEPSTAKAEAWYWEHVEEYPDIKLVHIEKRRGADYRPLTRNDVAHA